MSTSTSPHEPQVSLIKPKEIWNTMPGWGIVANLIPPELLATRRLRVVRRFLLIGLILLVLLLAAVYTVSWRQHSAAADDLAAAQAQTATLNRSQKQFAAGVQVQGNIEAVTKSLATLMTTDVDTDKLVGDLRAALPASMTINNLALTLNKSTGDSAGGGNPAGELDTGTSAHIGTVTLSGNAASIALVTSFVDRLASVPGVVQPYPANVSASTKDITWSISLTIDATRYSKRYPATQNGGN